MANHTAAQQASPGGPSRTKYAGHRPNAVQSIITGDDCTVWCPIVPVGLTPKSCLQTSTKARHKCGVCWTATDGSLWARRRSGR